MSISAISVDDEPAAHIALGMMLRAHPDIDLTDSFTLPHEAIATMQRKRHELLFLDIEMPGINGLDLLRRSDWVPITVLVTAHRDHALEAFDLGVREYLLKPVAPERLAVCLDRIRPLIDPDRGGSAPRPLGRIAVRVGHGHRLIDPREVIHVRAEGNFSRILFSGGDMILASEPLKTLERRMAPFGLLRVHRSHLVHNRAVNMVHADRLVLVSGDLVPIGRAFRPAMLGKVERST